MKAKGVGELGICGVGAAVANAIYNGCGNTRSRSTSSWTRGHRHHSPSSQIWSMALGINWRAGGTRMQTADAQSQLVPRRSHRIGALRLVGSVQDLDQLRQGHIEIACEHLIAKPRKRAHENVDGPLSERPFSWRPAAEPSSGTPARARAGASFSLDTDSIS